MSKPLLDSLSSSFSSSSLFPGSFNASLPDEYQPLLIGTTDRSGAHGDHEGGVDEQEHKGTGLEHEECELVVASFDWANVQNPMIIATFLFFSALTKISE